MRAMMSGAASAPLFGRLNPNCIRLPPPAAPPCSGAVCAEAGGRRERKLPPVQAAAGGGLAVQRALELPLVHLRAAGNVAPPRLGVELGAGHPVAGGPAGPGAAQG